MPADPDLDALDALLQAATPGEWKQGTKHPGAIIAGREWVGDFYRECDAALIAAAVNALPALLRRARIGDAAVALAEADAAHQAATAKHGLREEASVAAVQAYYELLAARRRWAEVEGRRA